MFADKRNDFFCQSSKTAQWRYGALNNYLRVLQKG